MYTTRQIPRVMLIGLYDPFKAKEEMVSDFEEVESLVNTFGGKVYAAIVQNKTRGSQSSFIGEGKVAEAVSEIEDKDIDIVVINSAIKPAQLHLLLSTFQKVNHKILVWDRVSLILEIFSKHARTSEAKLQIRFAKLNQMGPRIYGMGMELSDQGGGIGTRGVGETNTELMLRHWNEEKSKIKKELTELSNRRKDQIDHRKRGGLPTISLVGYTNAGKTSLFNRLTGMEDFVANALFATLDSTVNKFYLKGLGEEIYLSDTIGFIKNLPPSLIDAFRSTLLEAIYADLIVCVIDSMDPRIYEKIKTVQEILKELNIDEKNVMYVFNKIDGINTLNREKLTKDFSQFSPAFISAKEGLGMRELMDSFASRLKSQSLTLGD